MSVTRQTTKANQWVGVEYPGDPLEPVLLGFNAGQDEIEWKPAFFDQGKAVIRCPNLPEGTYNLWVQQGNRVEKVSRVRIEE